MKDAEIEAETEDFLEGFNQPTYRGMRVNGVRVHTSQAGWSGLEGRFAEVREIVLAAYAR
jgi:hypothetical protein